MQKYLNLYGRDVTDARAAEGALRDNERRLQTLFSKAGVGIVEVVGNDHFVAVNDRACEILGRSREELLAMNVRDLTWPDDRGLSDRLNADVHEGRRDRVAYEKRYTRGDGSPVWVHVTVSAVRDGEGRWVRSITTMEDIRERKAAEEALRRSEAQFRAVFEQAAIGIGRVSFADARWIDVNDAFCRMLGYTSEYMRTTPWPTMTHPDDVDLDLVPFRRMAAGELDGYTVEKRFIHRDGRYIWARLTLSLVRDAQGHPDYEIAIVEDITQRKHAEQQLAVSEERYRLLNRATRDVVWDWDLNTDELAWNDSVFEAFGYRAEELGPRIDGWYSRIHPDDGERVVSGIHAAIEGGAETWSDEYRFRHADGRYVHVLDRGLIARGADGRGYRMIGSMIDLTERLKLETALRESELFYRQTLESIPGMVFTTRPDGACDYVNRRWVEFTGVPAEQQMGTAWMRLLHPDDQGPTSAAWREAVAGRGKYDLEYRVRRHDGEYRWFKVRGQPIHDAEGRIVRWLGVLLEVEELKRAFDELAATRLSAELAKVAAEEANAAKDRFLAVLSHELRTPLTPVLASVSMLQKNPFLDDQTHRDLEMIRRNVELEARLIDDLLDLTRIARGKVELHRQRVELCTVIQRAVEVCRPDIEARRLHFGVDLGPDAPYQVDADVARLQQVFWNLLKNSIKFTPHGGCVGIRCRLEDDYVVAEVNDSGAGIDPEALPRIFDAFAQADRAITRQFGGLGLGLAISRSLVELHGGTIEARSAGKGRGATFRVRLPLVASAPSRCDGQSVPTAAPPVRQNQILRILVVEDHGDTAEMMKLMLQSEGHEVQTAADVATALDLADREDFDILISDLGLPDGSGLELMRTLRSRGYDGPSIALSGYGQESDIRQSRTAGFIDHMVKPVDMDRLVTAIAQATGEKGVGSLFG